jgi:hypothetical protein
MTEWPQERHTSPESFVARDNQMVTPREAGSIKTRLLPKLLAALNAAPEKTKFPKGDVR